MQYVVATFSALGGGGLGLLYSLYSGQLSNFVALTGRNPAILDCFDCEQTLCQLSNVIQGNPTPTLSPIQGSSICQCKLITVLQATDKTFVCIFQFTYHQWSFWQDDMVYYILCPRWTTKHNFD